MERSYNGWIASPNLADLEATRIEPIPGRAFTVRKVAAPLFAYLIRRFHNEVDPITGGVLDDWSYCYRKARAADALSCHASATAVDLNATEYPMGTTNMTKQQVAAVNRILGSCQKQFRWGGTFSKGYEDQMHFELVKGTSPGTVRKAIEAMRLHSDGRVMHPEDVAPDADPKRIKMLKQALASVGLYPRRPAYNGTWNGAVANAWDAWRMKRPKDAKQQRLDALGAAARLW